MTFSVLTFSSLATQTVRNNSVLTFSVLTCSCFATQTVRTNSVLTFSVLTFSILTSSALTKYILTFSILTYSIILAERTKRVALTLFQDKILCTHAPHPLGQMLDNNYWWVRCGEYFTANTKTRGQMLSVFLVEKC